MSKKKSTGKKTSPRKAKRAKPETPVATAGTTASDETDAAATAAEESRSRLPPAGTVIKKVDRHGAVRCQCTVVEEGIRYKGRVFRSLSGAAMAAAQDLGLTNKTQNVW